MQDKPAIESCFYQGTVRHRRFMPVKNAFSYRVFMSYIDIDKTDELFSQRFIFSKAAYSWIRFQACDYYTPEYPEQSLRQYIDGLLDEEHIAAPQQIMLLTNLRFGGFLINPISCFYCFDAQQKLIALVVRVTNTPWGEIKNYVLRCNPNEKFQRISFDKTMHVSPFNPMAMHYDWRNNTPSEHLAVHMDCIKDQAIHVDATMSLKAKRWSRKHQWQLALQYPLMTLSVAAGIYLQALYLLLKKSPLYRHPHGRP